jgi:hypothetical protein
MGDCSKAFEFMGRGEGKLGGIEEKIVGFVEADGFVGDVDVVFFVRWVFVVGGGRIIVLFEKFGEFGFDSGEKTVGLFDLFHVDVEGVLVVAGLLETEVFGAH